ncbi:MAG TPA: ABC transporter ATP-binding protein [Candidatus Binataceae bacterium]|nr:ABC transporter ATP-binding protein [Candidatus Binataceae bacterium]
MLEAHAITKRFGRTLALDAVDFAARPGEIHALIGENGAGKTTLMNVIAGAVRQDSGEARLDGRALSAGSPHDALAAGIAAVHQSPLLFERMTWEENLALGGFGAQGKYDLAAVASKARAMAQRLGFELPSAGALVEQRSVTERVRLELLRALSFEPRVLIFDEPTSVLAPSELAGFLDLLRRLRGENRIIIWITHKLAEAMAAADRITVLRQGRVVARTTVAETSQRELAQFMIGDLAAPAEVSATPSHATEPLLRIANLNLVSDGRTILDHLNLELRGGEITGLAGVDGNGQPELVELLARVRKPDGGTIEAAGSSSMAVIPEDRDHDGLVLDMTLWENMLLERPLRERFARRGWLDRPRAIELCAELIQRFRVRAPGPDATAASLSGGNRQRLEVARALALNPRIIIAHNVCRGLDLAATADVHRTLVEFAAGGGAVLLISSDLDELLVLCGRLLVISRGKIREAESHERNPERLGLLMAGAWD